MEDIEKELKDLKTKEYELERKKAELEEEDEKNKNYESFNERVTDWVVGKAHADIGLTHVDYSWRSDSVKLLSKAIPVAGNCGTSYYAKAQITGATHTFFHNVWSHTQKSEFQDKLNKFAMEEIEKIMNDLKCKLETMGLQSTAYYLNTLYPKDKIDIIKKEIRKEQFKILDNYSDDDFKKLIRKYHDKDAGTYEEVDLSHSTHILFSYIYYSRTLLIPFFEKTSRWKLITKDFV